jgi:hypothetical protein
MDTCKNKVPGSLFRAKIKTRFVSGHDFSRAVKAANEEGFSPCVRTRKDAADLPIQAWCQPPASAGGAGLQSSGEIVSSLRIGL